MNHSAFDDHIKEQLGRMEPEVPPHIWDNIMDRHKKRRPAAWWWRWMTDKRTMALMVLLLVGAGTVILYQNNNKTNNMSKEQLINNEVADNHEQQTHHISENPVAPIDKNPLSSEKPNDPVSEKNVENQSLAEKKAGPEKNKSSDNIKEPNTDPKRSATAYTTGKNKNLPDVSINKAGKNKKHKGRMLASITQADADLYANIDNDSKPGMVTDDYASLRKKILDLQKISIEKSMSAKIIQKEFQPKPIPCLEKDAAGNKKYIELYGGPDYAIRNYSDTANSQYLQKRKESTSITSAFSAGFRYTKVFSNAMSFRTGINYSQVNERFRFVQGNIVQVTYIINANGDTTGSFSTTGTRYKTSHNRYKTIDVPLLIGYEMGNGRLHANLNAGIIVNMYSWQKADVLDASLNPITITTGKSEASPYQFKNNIGLGFMGAASVYYKMNDNLHLLAEPFIRYNLSAANKADITLKQKFTTIGLRLGIRIDL